MVLFMIFCETQNTFNFEMLPQPEEIRLISINDYEPLTEISQKKLVQC